MAQIRHCLVANASIYEDGGGASVVEEKRRRQFEGEKHAQHGFGPAACEWGT